MQRAFGLAEGAPCFFDHTAFGMRPVDMGVAFHIVSVADVRVLKQLLSKPVAYFERQIERRQRGASAGRINDLLHISDDDDHDGHDGDYGDDDCMSMAQARAPRVRARAWRRAWSRVRFERHLREQAPRRHEPR